MADTTKPVAPIPANQRRQLLSCLVLIILVSSPCWGLPLLGFSMPVFLEWRNRVPFDPNAWKATEDHESRYHMSWDLVHGNILIGKSRSEVKGFLGKPMRIDVFSEKGMPMFSTPHFSQGVETWYYNLGGELYEFSIGPSGAVLAVDFQEEKVFDVRKVTH